MTWHSPSWQGYQYQLLTIGNKLSLDEMKFIYIRETPFTSLDRLRVCLRLNSFLRETRTPRLSSDRVSSQKCRSPLLPDTDSWICPLCLLCASRQKWGWPLCWEQAVSILTQKQGPWKWNVTSKTNKTRTEKTYFLCHSVHDFIRSWETVQSVQGLWEAPSHEWPWWGPMCSSGLWFWCWVPQRW